MPKYKLIYFDCKCRGEIIRMLFSVAGVPFEDCRIPLDGINPCDGWTDVQKNAPFGQVPLLEVDGEVLAQSHAIERYLAREFGMDGGTSLEKAKVDMWIQAADELIQRMYEHIMHVDEEPQRKEADKTKFMTVSAPLIFATLQKTLTANKSGFIVGDKLTVADLAFVSLRDWLQSAYGEEGLAVLANYKPVTDYIRRISGIPAVADWLMKRPKTQY